MPRGLGSLPLIEVEKQDVCGLDIRGDSTCLMCRRVTAVAPAIPIAGAAMKLGHETPFLTGPGVFQQAGNA